ncbi:MAG: ammonium transporter [Candidatus Eremiobacteraeota bacterium]|nr:ammonium transporter [Candidatus Eremiobacteraeota bacterium]
MDSGDTAWVLTAAALVMLMTPGLGFFYGGLVRRKNVLSTLMHSFFILCLISVQWVLWGYTLAFGPDWHGLIGSLRWIGLANIGTAPNTNYAPTIPHGAFVVFQMMFAVITPALITGALAERKRFKAFAIFTLLWATFIYDPLAHWVWGHNGWLARLGTLDFAGGTVVHISSGISALVAAKMLGPRIMHPREQREPHDVTMALLGTALLWFGWFGFNAGSALAANAVAVSAFINTNTAAAMGALVWMTIAWTQKGAPSVVGALAGAVAGLVAITPAAGYVTPAAAILIGAAAAGVCYAAVGIRERLRVDDALDVFAVHGLGGTVGAIATGLFATVAINASGANGLLYGNPKQLLAQTVAVISTWVFAGGGTYVILKFVMAVTSLRVSEREEHLGLDLSQHAEAAYTH